MLNGTANAEGLHPRYERSGVLDGLSSELHDTVGREGLYLPAIDDMTSPHQDQTLERGVMGAYLVRKYGGPS